MRIVCLYLVGAMMSMIWTARVLWSSMQLLYPANTSEQLLWMDSPNYSGTSQQQGQQNLFSLSSTLDKKNDNNEEQETEELLLLTPPSVSSANEILNHDSDTAALINKTTTIARISTTNSSFLRVGYDNNASSSSSGITTASTASNMVVANDFSVPHDEDNNYYDNNNNNKYDQLIVNNCRQLFHETHYRKMNWDRRDKRNWTNVFLDSSCGKLWMGWTTEGGDDDNDVGSFAHHDHLQKLQSSSKQKTTTTTIHVVVAYCKNPLGWLLDFLSDIHESVADDVEKQRSFQISMTIYSKCGKEHLVDSYLQSQENTSTTASLLGISYQVKVLPNVGGCDHTYAHWIATEVDSIVSNDNNDDDVVLFLKDTQLLAVNVGYYTLVQTASALLRMSNKRGFGCGLKYPITRYPRRKGKILKYTTNYAMADYLVQFSFAYDSYVRVSDSRQQSEEQQDDTTNTDAEQPQKQKEKENVARQQEEMGINDEQQQKEDFKSRWNNLGEWWNETIGFDELPIKNGKEAPAILQVCFGGWFAASLGSIRKHPAAMYKRIEASLERGDNIEEGHFAERTWASLFAHPLTKGERHAIRDARNDTLIFSGFSRLGTIELRL